LPSRRSKRVLNGYVGMFIARIFRRCVIHHDVSVRGNGEPDVDLEARAVTVFMTGSDYRQRHPVMRLSWVSSRSISLEITDRAASDGSEPSKVIRGGICIYRSFAVQRFYRLMERIDRPNTQQSTRGLERIQATRSSMIAQVLLGYLYSGADFSWPALVSMVACHLLSLVS